MAEKKKPAAKKKAAKRKGLVKQTKTRSKATEETAPAAPLIVGIGASAGGLEALETFFTHMDAGINIAFVVIQHLSPTYKSIMGSILSKYTRMEVLDIEDGMRVRPNVVYLNPPDKNVVTINGKLQLMTPIKTSTVNLPIDCFFRSMADDLGEKAICIILSGTATDGTLGLRAVKGAGGISMVQEPSSAKYDGMPGSAIATGLVDFILPVEKIPSRLIKYLQTPYIEQQKEARISDGRFENYIQKVFVLIRRATGHDFSLYKQTTIRRRIERRMAVYQISKISNYIEYLQKNPAEIKALFKDMLIGVTSFFRDPEALEIMKSTVLPDLIKSKYPDSPIRIWVVGCSTGEEAYSLAILLAELTEKMKHHVNIQIFASDIDAGAIEHARMGMYPDSIAADVSKERLSQFFIKEGNRYKVKKSIREMIIFAVQNVIKDPPFSKIDLASCRNLLIYLNSKLQKKILPLFHYTLNPDGILLLGTSESIGEFTDLFHPIDNKWKIFKRKDFHIERAIDYPDMPFYRGPKYHETKQTGLPAEPDVHGIAERVILDEYALPGALVNSKYEIVHFIGKTDKYLETPTGKASFNILKMSREGLRLKLSTALNDAARQKNTVSCKSLRVKCNNEFRTIDLTVRPLIEAGFAQGYLLVMFNDKTPSKKLPPQKGNKISGKHHDPVVTTLEAELESTREHLQTTIEEMETSSEELKSTNEELQSVNEELQSANEELETSKEELQSTNEELVTVNTELQNKVDELSTVNNDINNLLACTEIGTIFLDTQLCIKRFTPAMTKIFSLIQTDFDRPISDISAKIKFSNLEKEAKAVLETLVQKEIEVQDYHFNWYSMRIMPYRTSENVIDGIVITFVDITKVKKTENLLRAALRRLAVVTMDSNDAIMVQDLAGNILEWNKGAEQMYGYTADEALSLNISDLTPKEKKNDALVLVNKMSTTNDMEPTQITRITKDGKRLKVWLTATQLVDDDGNPVGVATTERIVANTG